MNYSYKNEIWKDIPGYEGWYQASDLGRIKSLDRITTHSSGSDMKRRGKILTPLIMGAKRRQYPCAILQKKGVIVKYKISQWVAITFLNYIPNGRKIVVDHIDNNPLNNRLDNLQVITHRENAHKNHFGKSSNYIGVSKSGNRWGAVITINWKSVRLGTFDTEIEANEMYNKALNVLDKYTGDKIKFRELLGIKDKRTSKIKGICKTKDKWRSYITIDTTQIYLGEFKTEEKAVKRLFRATYNKKLFTGNKKEFKKLLDNEKYI